MSYIVWHIHYAFISLTQGTFELQKQYNMPTVL